MNGNLKVSAGHSSAWVTLLTRTSYLPGAILLAHSLHRCASKYPLLILITSSFPKSLISTIEAECSLTNASILFIPNLSPPPENQPETLIASRFADTWTKLHVFSLHHYGYKKLVFLDADMLIMQNLDELFDLELPGRDWIAANHACVCNLDHDSWAPKDWTKENCAYTNVRNSSPPTPVPKSRSDSSVEGIRTHTLLNSGMFVFTPYEEQWNAIVEFLRSDVRVKAYLFPDQDFLADFFRNRWQSVGWQYNALKTMRYWHPEMWADSEVKNLHYIVDKPWSKRVATDGTAGYLGRDGATHQWWWDEYEKWRKERNEGGYHDIMETMSGEVATPLEDGKAETLHGNWRADS